MCSTTPDENTTAGTKPGMSVFFRRLGMVPPITHHPSELVPVNLPAQHFPQEVNVMVLCLSLCCCGCAWPGWLLASCGRWRGRAAGCPRAAWWPSMTCRTTWTALARRRRRSSVLMWRVSWSSGRPTASSSGCSSSPTYSEWYGGVRGVGVQR